MRMTTIFETLQQSLGQQLPGILGALVILIVGWLVALIVRAAVRKSLVFIKLNDRLRSMTGSAVDAERVGATAAYFLVLLLVLIAFFNALELPLVSAPLSALVNQLFAFAPKLLAAAVLLLVAFILATLLRKVATRALAATTLDEKLSAEAGMKPFSENLGTILYWLVFLLFLPGILGALEMDGLLQPVQGMMNKFMTMLPNIVAALAIGLIGWFVAKIVRDLVTNLLAAAGVDGFGRRAGLAESMSLSKTVGLIVYVFVLVPAVIAALDVLKIEAISAPATEMLGAFMNAVPNILAASIILLVAYFVSKFVAGLVTSLLEGVGFDRLPEKLGFGALSGELTPSRFVGKVIIFFAIVFAVMEAAGRLGLSRVSELVATFIQFGGQVLMGAVIIAVGLWIANLAFKAISGLSGPQSVLFAGLARYAILGLVFAMGLRAMGIADEIVNLAFGLTLGAVAVAVALSFGLGGREAAGRQMEHWLKKLRGE
jgi:hypothetical protein